MSVERVTANLPDDWSIVHNVLGRELRVAMAGITPVGAGRLTTLELKLGNDNGLTALPHAVGFLNANAPQEFVGGAGQLPAVFALHQNYPNPFNPATRISYDVPRPALVRLIVYNVLGQKVITLVDELQPAGKYVVPFNATNFASGMYFYRFTAGDFTSVKKMLLIK